MLGPSDNNQTYSGMITTEVGSKFRALDKAIISTNNIIETLKTEKIILKSRLVETINATQKLNSDYESLFRDLNISFKDVSIDYFD